MNINEVTADDILKSIKYLSKKEMKILTTIYHSPGCLLTSDELERKLNILPTEVGKLGKKIGRLCGVTNFGTYKKGSEYQPAYFCMVGNYTEMGWALNASIRVALKIYLGKK